MARHLLRLALSASATFDAEIFESIEIRNAAAWATVYLDWPECASLLWRMAENDPDERIRNGSRTLLESLKGG
ncbi:hypothetical protein [Amycolatopsis taiwanensis]|uniref:Uncharacterized protein n=1 Tax=Amycolatopsis taiwanensis TaxID=342230 RepID=A0A9W6R7W2_9PSEU|nr:hypothetical protein [Amycolatopsis taiwanensis]GLY69212.1 hypothetical protein Atai01_58310 [Amycolatopsis taiwanensis]